MEGIDGDQIGHLPGVVRGAAVGDHDQDPVSRIVLVEPLDDGLDYMDDIGGAVVGGDAHDDVRLPE